jgi:hypothetical protein
MIPSVTSLKQLTCATLWLAASVSLLAQSSANKGEIIGTVIDQNQGVIVGASVSVSNTGTGLVRDVTTNEHGQFRVNLLDPGTYDVSVEKSSFAKAEFQGVIVSVGATMTLPVTLQVGSTTQTVEVGAKLLAVDMPMQSVNVSNLAITNLPINGRRFQDFALLTPTAQVDNERGQLSFVGQRGINSNVMIDGADYNNPFFGGIRGGERSNFIVTIPQSAIQEFQVLASGYTAEYGRSTGGVLNAITKSGSNDWHGDAFYQLRHKELGKLTPFKTQILETLQQFGGSAGGAVKRDKFFVFGAYEQQISSIPRIIAFAALNQAAFNSNTQEAYSYYRSLEGPFKSTNDALALLGRADYQFSDASRLTLRYSFSDAAADNAASVGGAADTFTNSALSNNGNEGNRIHTGATQWTKILSPNAANDLRFQYTLELRPRTANALIPGVSNTIGQFGTRNFLPTTQDDKRIQFNDGLAITKGPHTFKFGADYSYLDTSQLFGQNQFGFFSFNTSVVNDILDIMSVGGPVANRFDSPLLTYQRQIGNKIASFNLHQLAFYAQDNWRATRRLTLDFGLRWEGQYNLTPEANNTSLVDRILNASLPVGIKVDPRVVPDATNQFMPRFGFTFQPFKDSSVIRGHAGLFYASTPMLLFADPSNNFRLPPGNVSLSLPLSGSTVYKDFLSVGVDLNKSSLDNLPILTDEQFLRLSGGRDPFLNARVTAMASDYANPRSLQMGIGFEQQFGTNWIAGVQYNHVNTVHLQRNRDVNLPAPRIVAGDRSQRPNFGVTASGAARVLRPISTLDRVLLRESSARSLYRGAVLSTQYRGRKFQMGAFYTISTSYSDDDAERTTSTLFHENAFNFRNEYGYSRLDARHQFTGNAVYQLPWGFEVSGIFRARSAQPFDPAAGSDLNQDGNNQERPFSAPGVPFARNSYRNYKFMNFDLRAMKNFQLGEGVRLQFSAELFNALNIDNVVLNTSSFASVNTIYGVGIDAATGQTVPQRATFRRLKLADGSYDPVNNQLGSPLQAQFGLRLFF